MPDGSLAAVRSALAHPGLPDALERAALAIDVLAAAPLLSATTLARATGLSIKGACALLDGFVAAGIAVEVTHRSARRLFGLSGMAPVRDATTAPRRPEPGRGRGRPRRVDEAETTWVPAPPPPPVARLERPPIDYAALEAAMAECERVIRSTRRSLDSLRHTGLAADRSEPRLDEDHLLGTNREPDISPLPDPW